MLQEEIEGEIRAMELAFTGMSLSAIIARCAEAVEDFYRDLPSDERYCLEIFRRALMDDNNDAWIALQEQFRGYLLYWFRRSKLRRKALQMDSEQNYVNDTFDHLWGWAYRQRTGAATLEDSTYRVEFTSLRSALTFLKKCLHNLILDRLRADERRRAVLLLVDDPPTSISHDQRLQEQEFWRAIYTVLADERERRIIQLQCEQGLRPRQILERCPDEFKNIQEIYRLTKNALDRLKSHKEIIRYKIDGEAE
jgi:DNA-directed RNA polymerase specialized sigma24 family protein